MEKLRSDFIKKVCDEQILHDGVHFELSPFIMLAFSDPIECYSILEEGTQKSEMKILLTKMASFLKDIIHPDGKISLFSDGGLNMAYSTLNVSVYENLVGEKTIQSGIIFSKCGYYGLRTRDNLILMDAAELAARNLPGHGHGDALSFEYSVKGCRVLIDPGVFEYDEENLDLSLATSSHNMVTLDTISLNFGNP